MSNLSKPFTPQSGGVRKAPAIKAHTSIEDMFAQYKNDTRQQKANILLLGAVGSGKTTAIGTMPGPILVISFDPTGIRSLKDSYPNRVLDSSRDLAEQIAEGKDILPYTNFEGITEENAREKAVAFTKYLNDIHNNGTIYNFKTVVIDSYTTMNTMFEWHQGLKDQSKNGSLPTLNDYGHINRYISNVVNHMCSEPYHFILTGHLAKDLEEATGSTVYQLEAYRSMQNKLPILFDFCFVMKMKQGMNSVEHQLITRSPLFAAKRRSTKLEDVEEPNLTNLMKKMGGLDIESVPLKLT